MDASTMVPVTGGLVVILLLVVAWLSIRHRVQHRFALRNVRRRPAEAALVVGGSLLGAALITGSFIVGDTLDTSIRATAYQHLGPIDEFVQVHDPKRVADIEREVAGIEDSRIDGVSSLVRAPAPVSIDVSGETLAEPRAHLVETDFFDARGFGGDADATGIEGSTPNEGEVVLTSFLAESIDAHRGDEITAYLYGRRLELVVARVLPDLGIAGFWVGFETTSPNAFVAPGTLSVLTARGLPEGAIPPAGFVVVSNRGGVEDGATLTDEVTPLIEERLGPGFRVEPIKEDVLDSAVAQGKEFSELFIAIGAFAIIAGILLLVNIFVMLAEERKAQLGMLRAVGMQRSDLVRGFVIEGAFYAFVAGIIGSIVGIGVGWGIVKLAEPIFGGFGDFSLDLRFSFTAESVVVGCFLGILIAFATVLLTSLRISRINIIRAIRDLPEPVTRRMRTRTLIAGTSVGVLSLLWFFSSLGNEDAFVGAIVAPPLAAFGFLPLLSRLIDRRIAVLGVSGFSLLWGVFGNGILGGQFFESGEMFAFVFQGVLLTFSAVVLLSQTQETFEGGIRKVAARNLPLRLGIAYPLARRFRTGLTLGMYALVIFTMVIIAVLAQVFGGQIDTAIRKEAGGYDVRVIASDSNPPSAREIGSVEGVEKVATLVSAAALFDAPGVAEPEAWPVSGVDQSFLEVETPELEERAPGYASDREVWEAVASDPSVVVVPEFFLQAGGGPPAGVVELEDTITMIDPATGREQDRRVIATGSAFPAFMSRDGVVEALAGRAAPSLFYLTVDGDISTITARLQGDFIRSGVRAESFRSIIEEFLAANLQFMRLMQSYLALGLLVGIAGLGVVMVRSVRERRREVGVLRSLGFLPQQVRRAFTLESGFTSLEGILVGASLALVTASQLVATGEFGTDIDFIVPWGEVGLLCGIALVASLAATAWPAHQASQIPPAVALRIAD